MKKWSELDCLVAAISHLIGQRSDLTKKKVAEAAGVSPPYLTQLLKRNRGKSLQHFEAIANACGVTICEAIQTGRNLLEGVTIEPINEPCESDTDGNEGIEGLAQDLDDLRVQVQQMQANGAKASGLIVGIETLEMFPFLRDYVKILNHACMAGDRQLAKDTLRRLGPIADGQEGDGDNRATG
jgi:transcriptional regulator with XRE-family HTH domain